MEINLRNVPFSEELLFFIRRCAGAAARDLEVRVQRTEVPHQVHEVCVLRRDGDEGVGIVESDPDVYLAVRNAFAVLRARDRKRETRRLRAAGRADGGVELYG